MWTSKLGNKYDLAWIQQQDSSSQRELHRLRSLKELGNHLCADCARPDSSWASVTHGVFLCITCSDVHRSVGTHVTKVKGCTGTYLWGPDELERMRMVGNRAADQLYGTAKASPDASKEEKQRFVIEKYGKQSGLMEKCCRVAHASAACQAEPAVVERHAEKGPSTTSAAVGARDMKVGARGMELHRVERPCAAATASSAVGAMGMELGAKGSCAGAMLLMSVPPAKKAELPDSLFDELFGDWTSPPASMATQPAQAGDHSVVGEHSASTEVSHRPKLDHWGMLGVVDDIFAELNRL